jgi:outer membrane protein assembly factor BamB
MQMPGWGFAGSPLIIGDLVVVAASGKLIAYEAATGIPRWQGPSGGDSYSSPHLATLDGVQQILLTSSFGITSVTPTDGTVLWKYAWHSDTRIMQPAVIPDGLLMSGGGVRRIAVSHASDESGDWKVEERWTSTGLKPGFNDFVVHEGHVYGFDGGILACIDLKDGARKWKGGRYGFGQLILLRDQGVLLVLSEEGKLALVKATPNQFTELAHFPAIEGKTWNHPVLIDNRLLVRNGEEMVAFRLSAPR